MTSKELGGVMLPSSFELQYVRSAGEYSGGYQVVHFSGSPSLLGIAEFIVPTGSFFHAQTPVSFHIIEELSPNVRMIPFSVTHNNLDLSLILGYSFF